MPKSVGVKVSEPKETINDIIVQSIQEKKGEEIACLDLTKINEAITDYFIICHADSTVQVKAITDHISKKVKDTLQIVPWHIEGSENLEWVLIDYFDVVVHVFLKERRFFYDLDELWNDAHVVALEEA